MGDVEEEERCRWRRSCQPTRAAVGEAFLPCPPRSCPTVEDHRH